MKLRPLLSLLAITVLAASVLFAQDKSKGKETELRTVRGTVVDKEETPVDTAVVYLKNVHSQDIITHLSDSDGTFRFSGLDINVDYEIHAEKDGTTSPTRSISNFDTRKEFVLTLKLDRKKSTK
jgi:carboxypeptidase family protein